MEDLWNISVDVRATVIVDSCPVTGFPFALQTSIRSLTLNNRIICYHCSSFFHFFSFLFLSFFFVFVQFDRVFSKTEWYIQMHAVSVDIQWGTPLLVVTAFERVAKHTMCPLCAVRTHVNLFQVCYTLTLLWYNVTAQTLPLCFMVISKTFCRCYCSYIQHDRISGRVSNMLTWIEWAMFVDFYTYSKLLSHITRSTMCSTTGLLCVNSW